MSLPGGIRTAIGLALLLIVGGALGGAYLMVVPSLEHRLVEERLDELERDAQSTAYAHAIADLSRPLAIDGFVDDASLLSDARVVVFQVFGPEPLSLRTLADSAASAGTISRDPLALTTAQTTGLARGRVERRNRPFAEVAVPLLSGGVLLLSTPIDDQLATVRVVKRRRFTRGGSAASNAPRTASRRGGSTSRSSISATTSSESLLPRSTACASNWRNSTRRARSSSRTPRTSCAHRSSRSPASSS